MIGIYAIFRKSDDKCMYVGESNNTEHRLHRHFKGFTHIKVNEKEHYGKVIETFDVYDKENQLDREAYWIRKLNPVLNKIRNKQYLYLIDRHRSEETKQKISEALKGKHRSEETKRKISETLKSKNKKCLLSN